MTREGVNSNFQLSRKSEKKWLFMKHFVYIYYNYMRTKVNITFRISKIHHIIQLYILNSPCNYHTVEYDTQ